MSNQFMHNQLIEMVDGICFDIRKRTKNLLEAGKAEGLSIPDLEALGLSGAFIVSAVYSAMVNVASEMHNSGVSESRQFVDDTIAKLQVATFDTVNIEEKRASTATKH